MTRLRVTFARRSYFYCDVVVRLSPGMPYLDFVDWGCLARGIVPVSSPGLDSVKGCLLAMCFVLEDMVRLVWCDLDALLRIMVEATSMS